MALGKSIKMYLTIFVATTCIYMVLYQYHISRQPIPSPEILKNKELLDTLTDENENEKQTGNMLASRAADLVRRYNLFLWSPMSMLGTERPSRIQVMRQQQTEEQQNAFKQENGTSETTQFISLNEMANSTQKPHSPFSSTSSSSSSSASHKTLHSLEALVNQTKSSKQTNNINSNSHAIHDTKRAHLTSQQRSAMQQSNDEHNFNVALYSNGAGNATATTASLTTVSTVIVTSAATTTATTTAKKTQHFLPKSLNSSHSSNSSKTSFIATSNKNHRITTTTTIATRLDARTKSENSKRQFKKFIAETSPPPLYIITPTYRRPEQLAELTRLGYTLKHVVNLLWLVIEDANKTSPLVTQTLNRIGVPYEYLVAPMPEEYKKTKKAKPRGVSNRNRGLQWLRENATEGVFYFADDDNTYDIAIFEQMRYTKKVSMWPVGLVTKYGVSTPIIRDGKIDGFYDGWIGGRKYAVDMAGFAVSVKFLQLRPAAKMPFKPGYEEDGFLKSLAPLNNSEIELLASECTEILTWHTQTKKNQPAERVNITKYGHTNLVAIDKLLVRP